MSSPNHSTRDLFQEEVTTRYTFLPDDVHRPVLSNDAEPESRRNPPEQGVSQVFAVTPMVPAAQPQPTYLRPTVGVEFVPLHIMRQLVAEYSEFLGPAAKPLIVAEIVSLHFGPERFPTSCLLQLAQRLLRKLDTSKAADQLAERLRLLHPCLERLEP